jgi:site-specific DNA-methyltransferase (adenine-specific)
MIEPEAAEYRNVIFEGSVSSPWPVPPESVDLIVTSPPYWHQRDNGEETLTWWGGDPRCSHSSTCGVGCLACGAEAAQLGTENDPRDYVRHLTTAIDLGARRCLRSDGQLWVNVGDSYSRGIANLPWGEPNQRLLIPYRVAMALQDLGWVLRSELIWAKGVAFEDGSTRGGGMPSAVHDRLTIAHEPFFGFVRPKAERRPYFVNSDNLTVAFQRAGRSDRIEYFSDLNAIRLKSVWVNENGERTDFYGRVAGSAPNAGASPKQHGISQPHLYIRNHPLGKNPGSVWQINLDPFVGQGVSHTAPYPKSLLERIIRFAAPSERCAKCGLPSISVLEESSKSPKIARCRCDALRVPGLVFDPFMGSGTTALAATSTGRDFVGLELNHVFFEEARSRVSAVPSRGRQSTLLSNLYLAEVPEHPSYPSGKLRRGVGASRLQTQIDP